MTPLEADLEPGERWTFDGDVTANFGDMLERSIPGHDRMRELTTEIGRALLAGGLGSVVDLGASRGDAIAPFVEYGQDCLAIETAPSMLEALRERFSGLRNVEIVERDLRAGLGLEPGSAALVLSVLTLQFVPVEYRLRLLTEIRETLREPRPEFHGGALILVEKTLASSPIADRLLSFAYWRHKQRQGYTDDEIERKRLALEGVLVPLEAQATANMLFHAGYSEIDTFWADLNFRGWVAIR